MSRKNLVAAMVIVAFLSGCANMSVDDHVKVMSAFEHAKVKADKWLSKSYDIVQGAADRVACTLTEKTLKNFQLYKDKLTPSQESVAAVAVDVLTKDCSDVKARHTLDFILKPYGGK